MGPTDTHNPGLLWAPRTINPSTLQRYLPILWAEEDLKLPESQEEQGEVSSPASCRKDTSPCSPRKGV